MSFISNGSIKKKYTTTCVLEIMPKLIMTHIADMMKENRHISIVAIRRLMNFIRIFKWFIQKDPTIQTIIDKKMESFKTQKESRNKISQDGQGDSNTYNIEGDYKNTPNLGDLLVFSIMSNGVGFRDIVNEYVDEQLDRQVLWWVKALPEIDFTDPKNKSKVDEKKRLEVTFELGKTGYYLNLFFLHLFDTIQKAGNQTLVKTLDANYGCLDR